MGFFMLDISEILDDEDFIESVEFGIVTRGQDSFGNPKDTEELKTHHNTNVQPASGNSLQRLPEGERSKPHLQVFTKKEFKIQNGDYMYYDGKKWRCVTDENWSRYGYYDGIFALYSGAQDIESETPNPWQ